MSASFVTENLFFVINCLELGGPLHSDAPPQDFAHLIATLRHYLWFAAWTVARMHVSTRSAVLLPQAQRDRATRCVSRHMANCCTTAGTSCTTNREQIAVMELEGYDRRTCNELCASINYVDCRRCFHTSSTVEFC